jgi:hypothetical protein
VKRLVLTALALVFLSLPALAAEALQIEKAKVSHRGTIVLRAWFDPEAVPDDFDPWEDGFEVTYGGVPIVTAHYERGRMSQKPGLLTKYRRNGEPRVRSKLDLGQGTLVLTAKKLEFPPSLLPLAFEFGLELKDTVFFGSATPEERKRCLRYRGDPPPAPGRALAARFLSDTANAYGETGRIEVYRDRESWWALHNYLPGGMQPEPVTIDFDTEMVVFVKVGWRPNGGYSVEPLGARERGDGVEVIYRELILRGCMTTAAITYHRVAVAVPIRPGRVTAAVKPKIHRCR